MHLLKKVFFRCNCRINEVVNYTQLTDFCVAAAEKCNSVCHRGDQRQVPGEEELDGRSLRAQEFRVERIGLQLCCFQPTKCHRLVSYMFLNVLFPVKSPASYKFLNVLFPVKSIYVELQLYICCRNLSSSGLSGNLSSSFAGLKGLQYL